MSIMGQFGKHNLLCQWELRNSIIEKNGSIICQSLMSRHSALNHVYIRVCLY